MTVDGYTSTRHSLTIYHKQYFAVKTFLSYTCNNGYKMNRFGRRLYSIHACTHSVQRINTISLTFQSISTISYLIQAMLFLQQNKTESKVERYVMHRMYSMYTVYVHCTNYYLNINI